MPEPITEQAERVLTLWQGSWVAAFAVGILVWGLIIWSVIAHRKRSEQLPPQVRYNMPIEALYTVLPIIVISVLFYFTARDQTYLLETDEPADVYVDVNAFQWSWQFTYEKELDVNGNPVSVAGVPSTSKDELPVLVLPSDSVVHFDLDAPDVIHSFWIPAFAFKMDAIPGHPNEFQVKIKPGVEGDYEGRCAELCGFDHSRMLFTLRVVTPDEYRAWIEEQKANPQELPASPDVQEETPAPDQGQDTASQDAAAQDSSDSAAAAEEEDGQ
ncbi:cytochrome C oxidase subunit II [Thermobifida cellulosilytica TB100]|uniref:cytochrome-c oxidase n=1 Tax=Thermobifida cellulosilytica TB100 TaxID=665004 RepID=A0A147KD33_THECS|nr:cytochrome c oxidase subunit II [Thermobifida cellulosilytica]KUP95160.1 cytochrome C oxidase subunit II [Thermobifida cellulosilytica TB100]